MPSESLDDVLTVAVFFADGDFERLSHKVGVRVTSMVGSNDIIGDELGEELGIRVGTKAPKETIAIERIAKQRLTKLNILILRIKSLFNKAPFNNEFGKGD